MSIETSPRLFNKSTPPRRKYIYEGSKKVLFDGPEPGTYILYFKDDFNLINNAQKKIITGKGVINNRLSELLMTRINEIGIDTHFIRRLNMREQLVRATEVLTFETVVHNFATGDFVERFGIEDKTNLSEPIFEFKVKSKDLPSSIVSSQHIHALGWADAEELSTILETTQRINDFLNGQFLALGIRLMQYSLKFGRLYLSEFMDESQIILIDEISPDTCHLLDIKTNQRLDIHSLQDEQLSTYEEMKIYQEIAHRFGLLTDGGPADLNISF